MATKLEATSSTQRACTGFTMPAPLDVFNADNGLTLGRLFFKTIDMSFACDPVRISAFNRSGNTSDRTYNNLGLTDGHHRRSHISSTASFKKIRAVNKCLFQSSSLLHDEHTHCPRPAASSQF